MRSDKSGGKGKRLDHGVPNKYRFALHLYHVDLDLPYSGVINSSTKAVLDGMKNCHAA
jgi:hypothetical protein